MRYLVYVCITYIISCWCTSELCAEAKSWRNASKGVRQKKRKQKKKKKWRRKRVGGPVLTIIIGSSLHSPSAIFRISRSQVRSIMSDWLAWASLDRGKHTGRASFQLHDVPELSLSLLLSGFLVSSLLLLGVWYPCGCNSLGAHLPGSTCAYIPSSLQARTFAIPRERRRTEEPRGRLISQLTGSSRSTEGYYVEQSSPETPRQSIVGKFFLERGWRCRRDTWSTLIVGSFYFICPSFSLDFVAKRYYPSHFIIESNIGRAFSLCYW